VLANNNPLSTTEVVGTVTISANNSVVLPPTLPATPSLPSFLTVASAVAGGGSHHLLSQAQLDQLVDAAIHRWAEAGATPEQLAAMRAVSVSVADLPNLRVGSSDTGQILIDRDAAGHGWFLDATPGDDSEFHGAGNHLAADAGGSADGLIDALSVIMHELGHQIGLMDDYHADSDGELMHGQIGDGERLLPEGLFQADAGTAPADLGDMALAGFDLPLHRPELLPYLDVAIA